MRILKLLALVSLLPSVGFGDMRLKGIVTDWSDTPISNAMVFIHWDSAGSTVDLTSNVGIKEDLVIRTKSGRYVRHWICVQASMMSSRQRQHSPQRAAKFAMKPSETQEIRLRLKVDPLYTAEMGDRIESALPKRSGSIRQHSSEENSDIGNYTGSGQFLAG